jgi:hypothetical protein
MEIFNEACVLLCFLLTLLWTPIINSTTVYKVNGFAMLGVSGICILVNLVFVFVESFKNAKENL